MEGTKGVVGSAMYVKTATAGRIMNSRGERQNNKLNYAREPERDRER